MATSHPRSGPSKSISHSRGSTTFRQVKQTPKYTRTQSRTYRPPKSK
jgi:hypothetical protein